MHADLETRRRVLLLTYRRYLEADRAWNIALREMRTWFPTTRRPVFAIIGNPGSPIRRLYEQRARAMHQLDVAHSKLESAKQRLAARQRKTKATRILLITHVNAS